MISYPNNQTYVIMSETLDPKLSSNFFAASRKKLDKKKWIWHWDNKNPILKELAKNPNCELLSHAEAIEKMKTKEWKSQEKELHNLQN